MSLLRINCVRESIVSSPIFPIFNFGIFLVTVEVLTNLHHMCLCLCDGGPFNLFPKVNELGIGMCVFTLFTLSMLLVGVSVTGIVYGVENAKRDQYDEANCTVLDAKVVSKPYSMADCEWHPSGSSMHNYYHPVVASWKVSYIESSSNAKKIGRTYDSIAACPHFDEIPQHRLGLHHVNSTDVCYFDTKDYEKVRWTSPSETSHTYLIVMISLASAFVAVILCLMLCKRIRPWETPQQRQNRLDEEQREAESYRSLDNSA